MGRNRVGHLIVTVDLSAVFSFLYLKKIKISKIFVRFGKFQKYTPVALWGRQGSNVIFSSSNLQRNPWRKKKRGACRPPQGRQAPVPARGAGRPSCGRQGGPVAPPRATGACRPWGGRQGLSPVGGATGPPLFFFSRDFVANLKKKNYI